MKVKLGLLRRPRQIVHLELNPRNRRVPHDLFHRGLERRVRIEPLLGQADGEQSANERHEASDEYRSLEASERAGVIELVQLFLLGNGKILEILSEPVSVCMVEGLLDDFCDLCLDVVRDDR